MTHPINTNAHIPVHLISASCHINPSISCRFFELYGEMYRESKIIEKDGKVSCFKHAGRDVACNLRGVNCACYQYALEKHLKNQGGR